MQAPLNGAIHEIKANEELIGVYGKKGTHDFFDAFGFIVREIGQ